MRSPRRRRHRLSHRFHPGRRHEVRKPWRDQFGDLGTALTSLVDQTQAQIRRPQRHELAANALGPLPSPGSDDSMVQVIIENIMAHLLPSIPAQSEQQIAAAIQKQLSSQMKATNSTSGAPATPNAKAGQVIAHDNESGEGQAPRCAHGVSRQRKEDRASTRNACGARRRGNEISHWHSCGVHCPPKVRPCRRPEGPTRARQADPWLQSKGHTDRAITQRHQDYRGPPQSRSRLVPGGQVAQHPTTPRTALPRVAVNRNCRQGVKRCFQDMWRFEEKSTNHHEHITCLATITKTVLHQPLQCNDMRGIFIETFGPVTKIPNCDFQWIAGHDDDTCLQYRRVPTMARYEADDNSDFVVLPTRSARQNENGSSREPQRPGRARKNALVCKNQDQRQRGGMRRGATTIEHKAHPDRREAHPGRLVVGSKHLF